MERKKILIINKCGYVDNGARILKNEIPEAPMPPTGVTFVKAAENPPKNRATEQPLMPTSTIY